MRHRASQVGTDWPLIGLLAVLYVPLLVHWYDGWLNKTIGLNHEYFSHGVVGLPVAAYLAWNRRQHWQQIHQGHWSGLLLLAVGLTAYLRGVPDGVNLSLPLVLLGLCLWLKGWSGVCLQALPLGLVALATPTFVPSLLAPGMLPLQRAIAGIAGFLLMHLGLAVQVDGIYLYVNQSLVEIAPHCAGLKLLFTNLYVGLIVAHWRSLWASSTRAVLFFGGILGISIMANLIRSTGLSYLYGTGQTGLFDWLHAGWGGDIYSALTLFALIGFGGLVSWMAQHVSLSQPGYGRHHS